MACASRTRCRMPLEYAATLRFAASVRLTRSSAFHARSSASDRPYPNSSSPVVMKVNPVAQRGAVSYCVAYPVIRISVSGSRGEIPRTRMRPWSGKISPVIMFISVVLPEPFGPTRLVMPGGMFNVTRFTPSTSP